MKNKPALSGGEPVREDFLIFGSPRIEQDEIAEVVDSLESGWLSTGPKVEKFEEAFKRYIGCKYAVALNSCTAGLHLSMIAAGIKPGDEVITTPMTFAATANSIIHVGARPVFADVELPSMNIDPAKIAEKITSKTKAIMPVHFAGRPCNMDSILDLSRKYNLLIIEDAAHAIEASYHGRKVGTIGDLTAFSFYVTKNIVMGEGGIVTTNNQDYADKIKIFGLHGLSKDAWKRYSDEGFKHYQVIFPGYKYNLMDMQAGIGLRQLEKVERYSRIRQSIWNRYNEAFKGLPLSTPADPEPNTRHAMHLYTVLLNLEDLRVDRDAIQQALFKENIGTGIHFVALNLHPFYVDNYGYKKGDFPNAEFISERTISLPFSAKLNQKDVNDVILAVKKVLRYYGK
ncbi:MAG TPA: DegT/DnrJ/EryC1/StrS family aminotransferase [Candidatus Marinimicrobia bacterium]|nr:DegT/DnrJ/EryC1/StrS family aminotransferase [Candidatus Neomarinimicrobiota bacterium]